MRTTSATVAGKSQSTETLCGMYPTLFLTEPRRSPK